MLLINLTLLSFLTLLVMSCSKDSSVTNPVAPTVSSGTQSQTLSQSLSQFKPASQNKLVGSAITTTLTAVDTEDSELNEGNANGNYGTSATVTIQNLMGVNQEMVIAFDLSSSGWCYH